MRFKNLTPEMRIVYDLVAQQTKEFFANRQQRQDEKRLKEALRMGCGRIKRVSRSLGLLAGRVDNKRRGASH